MNLRSSGVVGVIVLALVVLAVGVAATIMGGGSDDAGDVTESSLTRPEPCDGYEPVSDTATELVQCDRGERVAQLQRDLAAAGFDVGPSGADGCFGPDTFLAVMRFQLTDEDLRDDGRAGQQTLARLDALTPADGSTRADTGAGGGCLD